jgi:hypothetical protein
MSSRPSSNPPFQTLSWLAFGLRARQVAAPTVPPVTVTHPARQCTVSRGGTDQGAQPCDQPPATSRPPSTLPLHAAPRTLISLLTSQKHHRGVFQTLCSVTRRNAAVLDEGGERWEEERERKVVGEAGGGCRHKVLVLTFSLDRANANSTSTRSPPGLIPALRSGLVIGELNLIELVEYDEGDCTVPLPIGGRVS